MLATHEKPDTINLNVGGELFTTRLETLQLVPDSLLGKMFEDNSAYGKLPRDKNGVVFFDRDPKAFSSVLDYLQRGGRVIGPPESDALLARVRDEADYFGLVGMVDELDKEMRARKVRNNAMSVMQAHQLKASQDLNEWIEHLFSDEEGFSLLHKVNANLELIAYSAHPKRREIKEVLTGPLYGGEDETGLNLNKSGGYRDAQRLAEEGFKTVAAVPVDRLGKPYHYLIMEREHPVAYEDLEESNRGHYGFPHGVKHEDMPDETPQDLYDHVRVPVE